MIKIVREIVKFALTIVGWGFPIILAYINYNMRFLWFFVLSVFLTTGLWNHYENLERIDKVEYNGKEVPDEA